MEQSSWLNIFFGLTNRFLHRVVVVGGGGGGGGGGGE